MSKKTKGSSQSTDADEIIRRKAMLFVERYYDDDMLCDDLSWIQAKTCALIAVDEILELLKEVGNNNNYVVVEFWLKVKYKIKEL